MAVSEAPAPTITPVPLAGIDFVELWVGNARQAAGFLSSAFGFEVRAYRGPETTTPDRASYWLCEGDVQLVVTGAVTASSEVAEHVRRHGDGVRDLAFRVDDADETFRILAERGATPAAVPWTERGADGAVRCSAVRVYGDTRHVFVERDGRSTRFLPGFVPCTMSALGPAVGLRTIDHVVANVEEGQLARWVEYYEHTFGFSQLRHFGADVIHSDYSALSSTVMWNGANVVLPINEPAQGLRRSQISEYLEYYGSPGIQHLAFSTDDIVATVTAMRARGVRFLEVPPEYYEEARARLAGVDLPWRALQALGVLVDRDERGHLLQVFTENLGDRPTLFVEVIQRAGATGFGEGNFRALFEAIERAQAQRGNL